MPPVRHDEADADAGADAPAVVPGELVLASPRAASPQRTVGPVMANLPVLYIAGDVHLGAAHGGGDRFPGWLDGLADRAPARLVILGDLFEYWIETAACAASHRPLLERLRRLVAAGWRVDLVRGNRESVAGRMLAASAGGMRLHWPSLDIVLGTTRLRVVHGDRLVHEPGYRLYAAWMQAFPMQVFARVGPAPAADLVARLLRARSKAKQAGYARSGRRPFIDPRRVRGAARGADLLVAGHVHERWRRRFGGVDFSLVGDWPPGGGSWIEGYADGTIAARTLEAA